MICRSYAGAAVEEPGVRTYKLTRFCPASRPERLNRQPIRKKKYTSKIRLLFTFQLDILVNSNMSDGKLFVKSKSSELKSELDQAFKKSKPQARVKIVLKKVIANIILNNNELANLFPDIVQLMKLDDLEIRKLCFHYVSNYATLVNISVACESLPFFQRFVQDTNPVLRALSLRTLSSVPLGPFVELTFGVVKRLLADGDQYVRKAAAYSVLKLYQHDPKHTVEFELIDALNDLLYDSDPVVVSNALAALSFITEQQHLESSSPKSVSLSLTIDRAHALTLASFLNRTNEWCQIYILNALLSFVPQTQEDALVLFDKIYPSLQHENSAVVLDSIKCIIYLCNYVKRPELVIPTLQKKLGSSLVSLLLKNLRFNFSFYVTLSSYLLGNVDYVILTWKCFSVVITIQFTSRIQN